MLERQTCLLVVVVVDRYLALPCKAGSQFQAQAAGCEEKRAALLSVDSKYFMTLLLHLFLACVFARAD